MAQHRLVAWSVALSLSLVARSTFAADAHRVAVFDPQTNTMTRVEMNVAEMNGVAETLKAAGLDVGRVTTEQIDDAKAFDATHYDVLVLRGDGVPRANFPEIERFAHDGGVVVALAAKAPFLTAVAKDARGQWTVSPTTPQFAWQTQELMNVFGLGYEYRPSMLDTGLHHAATPMLKKYLPDATDFTGPLASTWIFPTKGGEVFPLIRSTRGDGKDVTPQVYVAQRDGCRAVISSGDRWVKGADGWTLGSQTTVALVRVALDLRSGALKLTPNDKVEIPADLAPADPLTSRLPTGQVNPDDAPVVARWGKFDGSGTELDATDSKLPRVLKAGESVTLPLTQNDKPLWLRVRAAVGQSNAAMKVSVGGRVLWNETIAYSEVADVGNFGKLSLSNAPVEFNRRVFVPPTDARDVVISNPGRRPLYFDAVQLENDPARPVTWITSMNASDSQMRGGPSNLPPAVTRTWTGQRSTFWLQGVGAPGTPNRWDALDARMARYRATGAPLEMLIEGVPEWAAITPARYAAAERKWTVPPDLAKYGTLVNEVLKRYGENVSRYEIWNEEDSQHYWLGSATEFVKTWRTIVPRIRAAAPNAEIFLGGLTGFDKSFLDTLSREGVLKEAAMVGFHPYAGAEAAWDKPFGAFQGQLYALGENLPIYNNEMGFPSGSVGWFTKASFPYTLATQTRMTDVSLARLLANNVTKFSLFLSGGSNDPMGYIDANGEPKPAYRIVQDYQRLSANGGTRCDVSIAREDGAPQTGVYVAGARHADGTITVIVNPAEVVPPKFDAPADAPLPTINVPVVVRVPLGSPGAWTAKVDDATVPLTVVDAGDRTWGELAFTLTRRSTVTIGR